MPLSKGAKIGIIAGSIAVLTTIIIIIAKSGKKVAPKAPAKGGDGAKTPTPSGGGQQASQQTTKQQPTSQTQSTPAANVQSAGNAGVSAVNIDLSGNWISTQDPVNTTPSANKTAVVYGNPPTSIPYSTMSSNTVVLQNLAGADIGTISNVNPDGTIDVGETITWNDANGDTWTKQM